MQGLGGEEAVSLLPEKGEQRMTAYMAIEKIIEERLGDASMISEMVFKAYMHNLIDGYEYEALLMKVKER